MGVHARIFYFKKMEWVPGKRTADCEGWCDAELGSRDQWERLHAKASAEVLDDAVIPGNTVVGAYGMKAQGYIPCARMVGNINLYS